MSNAKPAFLFVHGAWHNRQTWDRVAPLLTAQGYQASAIDLPGAGRNAKLPASFNQRPLDPAAFATEPSPNADVTQADRTACVIAEIDALGGDVVLVGHSLGGLTISAVGEAVPEKLRALVYLTAFLLPPGMPAIAMIQHESMAAALVPSLLLADPVQVGALRLDTASTDADYRSRLKACFYGDVSDFDFDAMAKGLHCDEPVGVCIEPSPITAERLGKIPRHYIRCTNDRAITIDGQDFMIGAVDAALSSKTRLHTLASSHSPFCAQPDRLVAALIEAAA